MPKPEKAQLSLPELGEQQRELIKQIRESMQKLDELEQLETLLVDPMMEAGQQLKEFLLQDMSPPLEWQIGEPLILGNSYTEQGEKFCSCVSKWNRLKGEAESHQPLLLSQQVLRLDRIKLELEELVSSLLEEQELLAQLSANQQQDAAVAAAQTQPADVAGEAGDLQVALTGVSAEHMG